MEIVIVHNFFAHYREAIVRELINNSAHHYVFAGERKDIYGSGIKACNFTDQSRFIYTPFFSLFGRIHIQKGLIYLALNPRFDVIIYLGDWHFISTWISAFIARIRGKRVLFWTHGWLKRESGLRSFVRCSFYRLGHGLLLYGQRAKQFGLEKGFKSDNLYVVYNSLDIKKQEEIRSKITANDIQEIRLRLFGHWNKPVVMFSGRLITKNQLDLLFEAISLLQGGNHHLDMLIVGDGPQRDRLETITKTKGLSVLFYGACYEEEILARLIMSANVIVVPGAIGLTVMHSLIYGTPVITHNDANQQGPEWEAIKSGINGEVFEKGSIIDLARVIKKWTNSNLPNEDIRNQCYSSIDKYYDPFYQVQVINASIEGQSADQINYPGF